MSARMFVEIHLNGDSKPVTTLLLDAGLIPDTDDILSCGGKKFRVTGRRFDFEPVRDTFSLQRIILDVVGGF